MSKNKYVIISINKLADLIENSEMYKALEAGGVNNWEWYGESLCDYISDDEKYPDFDEYINDITSEEYILKNYPSIDAEVLK